MVVPTTFRCKDSVRPRPPVLAVQLPVRIVEIRLRPQLRRIRQPAARSGPCRPSTTSLPRCTTCCSRIGTPPSAGKTAALDALIRGRWPPTDLPVLDIAAGIGTQAIGLASLGYRLIASDLSRIAIRRARDEAIHRGVPFPACVADFSTLPYRTGSAV